GNFPRTRKMSSFFFQIKGITSLKKRSGKILSRITFLKKTENLSSVFIFECRNAIVEQCFSAGCSDVEWIKIKQPLPPNRPSIALTHPYVNLTITVRISSDFLCRRKKFRICAGNLLHACLPEHPDIIEHHHRICFPGKLIIVAIVGSKC